MTKEFIDYSQMTNLEINKAVAALVGKIGEEGMIQYPMGLFDPTHTPNFCEVDEYAFPIILENKISINWVGTYWQILSPLNRFVGGEIAFDDHEVLRVAMICFLKMNRRES